MGKYSNPSDLSCSFCHKPQREVEKIIAGPNVYICSECVRLCLDIIRENTHSKPVTWGQSGVPAPAKIKAPTAAAPGQKPAAEIQALRLPPSDPRLESPARGPQAGANLEEVECQL